MQYSFACSAKLLRFPWNSYSHRVVGCVRERAHNTLCGQKSRQHVWNLKRNRYLFYLSRTAMQCMFVDWVLFLSLNLVLARVRLHRPYLLWSKCRIVLQYVKICVKWVEYVKVCNNWTTLNMQTNDLATLNMESTVIVCWFKTFFIYKQEVAFNYIENWHLQRFRLSVIFFHASN